MFAVVVIAVVTLLFWQSNCENLNVPKPKKKKKNTVHFCHVSRMLAERNNKRLQLQACQQKQ